MMFPDWRVEWNVDGLGSWRVTYTPHIRLSVTIECQACDGIGTILVFRGSFTDLDSPPWPWKKMKPTDPAKVLAMAKRVANRYMEAPR